MLKGEIICGEAQRKIFFVQSTQRKIFSQTKYGKLGSVQASVESIYPLVPHVQTGSTNL
jgi:hypothetical protein